MRKAEYCVVSMWCGEKLEKEEKKGRAELCEARSCYAAIIETQYTKLWFCHLCLQLRLRQLLACCCSDALQSERIESLSIQCSQTTLTHGYPLVSLGKAVDNSPAYLYR